MYQLMKMTIKISGMDKEGSGGSF